ncbi:hypothetical protein ACLQ29_33805 [Micromonospora sp. DT228]|uniref:hypothetical protein n=1 Tax=Micromonospora sp. DT228 TaxID=3393443 RepID=UPI003CF8EB01
MRRPPVKLALAVSVGLVAWSLPSLAIAATKSTNGSVTRDVDNWQGISVEDTSCDNHDVYSDYKRDSGSAQVFRNSQGCGTTETSSKSSSNLIQRFNSCVDDVGTNTCSSDATR